MRRILIPYDFSPQAQRALSLALDGIPFGAEVTIDALYVIDERLYRKHLPGQALPLADAMREHFKGEIARATTTARQVEVDPVFTVVNGRPVEEISKRLEGYGGALIGGQGHGGLGEGFLGTTAQRVLRDARVPLYVVKKTTPATRPKRVLCSVDDDDVSIRALKECATFCKLNGASLELMRVQTVLSVALEPSLFGFYPTPSMVNEERDQLISFELRALGGMVADKHVVTFAVSSIASDVAQQATLDRIDTIVVGAHRESASKRFLGSVSESIVQQAACDVFVVR